MFWEISCLKSSLSESTLALCPCHICMHELWQQELHGVFLPMTLITSSGFMWGELFGVYKASMYTACTELVKSSGYLQFRSQLPWVFWRCLLCPLQGVDFRLTRPEPSGLSTASPSSDTATADLLSLSCCYSQKPMCPSQWLTWGTCHKRHLS